MSAKEHGRVLFSIRLLGYQMHEKMPASLDGAGYKRTFTYVGDNATAFLL